MHEPEMRDLPNPLSGRGGEETPVATGADAPQPAHVLAASPNQQSTLPGTANRAEDPAPKSIGVVDIGTNSIHLVMAEASASGNFRILGRDKVMVQLGKGGFKSHRLTPNAMRDGIDTLKRFNKLARLKKINRLRAYATSAVREATNGGEFVARVREQLDLNIQVISPEEEARLIFLAVSHSMALNETNCLVADIGGGSLEMIVGNRSTTQLLGSAKLGASRLAELFLENDPPRMAEIKALRRHIQVQLDPWLAKIRDTSPQSLIGTSGTVECLFEMIGGSLGNPEMDPLGPATVMRSQIKTLIARLRDLPRPERLKLPGMENRRVDMILPGAIVLHTLMKELGMESIQFCGAGLREGMILDHVARKRRSLEARVTWPDPRPRSVIHLAERCCYHRGHAEKVAQLSLKLFDGLREIHGLGDEYREWLHYGALLHDIGYHIGHRGHHKHSYYLIRHGELRGFEPQEIEVIANIARYHRKESPKRDHFSFQNLTKKHRKAVKKLSVLLRLANALDRTHYGVVDDVHSSVYNDHVDLEVCTGRDAELEMWAAHRLRPVFEKRYKRSLNLRLATWASEDTLRDD